MCLKCLESIDGQSRKPDQVILVDDASSDSIEPIEEFMTSRRWLLLRNEENRFVGYSRERALKYVTATHVVFIDDDDWFYPNALDCFFQVIQENGQEPHSFLLDVLNEKGEISPQLRQVKGRSKDINDFLRTLVSIHATIVPLEQLKLAQHGHSLRYYVDIYLWLQIHLKTGAWNYHNQRTGVYNRVGQDSITKVSTRNYKARIQTFRLFIRKFQSEDVLIWSHERMQGAYFCLGKEAYEGVDSVLEYLKSYLFSLSKMRLGTTRMFLITFPKLLISIFGIR